MLLQRVKYFVDFLMKYGLFRQQASSPPKMAVHSTPGNQATRMLFLRFVSVPDYLDRENFQHMDSVRYQNIIPVVNAVNGIALDFEIPDSLGGKYPMEVMSKC